MYMKFIVIFFLMLISESLSAQQYLYIKQGNEFPAVRYGISDRVKFRTGEDLLWVSGIIREIGSDFIRINNVIYPFEEIIAFRSSNELLNIGGTALRSGAVLFTGLAFINGVINNDNPVIKGSQLIWGGALVAVGFGMVALARKDYYREDGWYWLTIDLTKDLGNG